MRLLSLIALLLCVIGCHQDSNNSLLGTDNEPPSPNIFITTTTMGFGHVSEGPEDIYGPFIFETEGTFVGVPSWTFSGELLDARLQPLPGIGNTIGILVGTPATVGTFFITATVLDTGNGVSHTVTVPFTVVDCTVGVLGTNILGITASVPGLAAEGTPFPVSVSVTGALAGAGTVVWRATSADPTVTFEFTDPSMVTTMIMTNHTVVDSPISVIITAIDNDANIDEIDSEGFYEQIMGSGSGCSISTTLDICVAGGSCSGGGGGGGGAEICTNGIDDDGDTLVDCGDPDCAADPSCAGGGAGVFISTDTPVVIPAAITSVTSTIDTGTTAPTTSIRVGLDIDHTFIGDLTISLAAPGDPLPGTTLIAAVGSSGVGMDVILADTAAASITTFGGGVDTTPPFPSFSPSPGTLASFIGSTGGVWTLTIADSYALDGGTLNEWGLAFDGAVFPTPYE